MRNDKKIVVLSLGGSIIVPHRIDWNFLKKFKDLIVSEIKKGIKFIIITGGGYTCREYQQAAMKVTKLTKDDRDWLGIHSTRLNAHLLRAVFRDYAHPVINTNPNALDDFFNFRGAILVASGWRPGFSTDYDAVTLGKYFGVKTVVNLSNIDYAYDKDPNKFGKAKKIKEISWKDFRKIVGNKWDPGLNMPFDPIASKIAQENGMEVVIMNGRKIGNLKKFFNKEKFEGTVIR